MVFNELQRVITQVEFGGLVGLSQPAVSDLARRGVLREGATAAQWLIDYCAHIREQAAGRAAGEGLNLATERAGLAREQRLLTEIKRRTAERDLAPVALMTKALAKVAAQLAATLDALPGRIKRACGELPATALDVVEQEISKARNAAAEITIDLGEFDDDADNGPGDPQGDNNRARAA